MKCPQREVGVHDEEGKFYYESAECLKEECAWWDDKAGGCSIYLISRNLMGLFDVSVDVKEKMPHKEQFKSLG